MKTTIEIPDPLFRKAKSRAAEQGVSLKDFVTEALKEKLYPSGAPANPAEPQWMAGFGKLRRLRSETARNYAASDQAAAAARKALVDALPGALAAALQAIQNPQLAVAADALMASAAPHEPPK